MPYTIWFKDCSYENKHLVGGKCSSLGELYHLARVINFDIADGFAISTELYDDYIEHNNLAEKINEGVELCKTSDLKSLEQNANILKMF